MGNTRNRFTEPSDAQRAGYLAHVAEQIRQIGEPSSVGAAVSVGFMQEEIKNGGKSFMYVGKCQIFDVERRFLKLPPNRGTLAINAIQQTALIFLKPIDSLKQLLSAHKNTRPFFCEGCDTAIVICPFCLECCGRAPIGPTQKVSCSHCGAVV